MLQKRLQGGSGKNISSLRLWEGFQWAYHVNSLPETSKLIRSAFSGKRFWFPKLQRTNSSIIQPLHNPWSISEPYRSSCWHHAHAIDLISHQRMLGCHRILVHQSVWHANGNSTRIIKDDLSASLRYCTVPFIIFTSFWLMYRLRPSLETWGLWWNISWIRFSGTPGAGWVILPCEPQAYSSTPND